MIRDPSDGSVKRVPKPNSVSDKTNSVIDSGLPMESKKPENIARIEKSRRQLELYRKTGQWNESET